MEENRCLALLLCDGAAGAANGKIDLLGVFDRIEVIEDCSPPQTVAGAQKPAHLADRTPLFFVFYKILVTHACTVQLHVLDPTGNPLDGGWKDEIAEPALIQTVWALNLKDFRLDGAYTFQLMCGQHELSETTLYISHNAA